MYVCVRMQVRVQVRFKRNCTLAIELNQSCAEIGWKMAVYWGFFCFVFLLAQ